MHIDTPAYIAAISQLAKALAEFDPAFVHQMLEEEAGLVILHDLSVVMIEQQPTLYDALRALNA
jgi:hypothetical protein